MRNDSYQLSIGYSLIPGISLIIACKHSPCNVHVHTCTCYIRTHIIYVASRLYEGERGRKRERERERERETETDRGKRQRERGHTHTHAKDTGGRHTHTHMPKPGNEATFCF